MKSKLMLKHFLQLLARRSVLVFALLIFAIGALMIWFLLAKTNNSSDNISFISVGVSAIAAYFAAIAAFASLLQAVEVQRQREDRERPYIYSFFDATSNGAMYLVIENSGNSPAVNINFTFDPAPIDFNGRKLDEISLFSNPITFMPAGQVIRQFINASNRFLETGNQTKYIVKIKYYSIFGASYDQSIEHNLEYLKQTTLPRKTSDDYLKDIAEKVNELNRTIKGAQTTTSFLVETPSEHALRMNLTYRGDNKISHTTNMLQEILAWLFSKLRRG